MRVKLPTVKTNTVLLLVHLYNHVLIHINCTAKGMLLFFIIVMDVYVHDVM